MNLKGRDFLKIMDFSPAEIEYLLNLAADLKNDKKNGITHRMHEGKNIALIFEKTSTRTRCSFEVAAMDLGMGVTFLGPEASQLGKKETVADTARVLTRMYDAIEYRGFEQEMVEQLAEYADVPVYNGLTDTAHPTQILADFLTIKEHLGRLKGLKFVMMGDNRYNMGYSLMAGAAKMGMHFVACGPEGYYPDEEFIERCREVAKLTGATIELSDEPKEAVKDADIICTDIWVSMAEPEEAWAERIDLMMPFQVNSELMEAAGEKALFMHCLPAYHNMDTEVGRKVCEKYGVSALEVTDEVFESERSIVFDEAENRMHTIKAVMAATL